MPFKIIQGDVTKMDVDAIVNAANTSLTMGGGVCGAIFLEAGPKELQEECDRIHMCPPGSAVITSGYKLKAKHIIHAVGPIWQDGQHHEEALLRSAYLSSLKLAKDKNLESIAFPLISSGIYGYPKEDALRVAREAITDFLENEDLMVYLVLYDQKSFQINEKKLASVKEYVADYYIYEQRRDVAKKRRELLDEPHEMMQMEAPSLAKESTAIERVSLEDFFNTMEETFSRRLLKMIDQKGYTDVEVYRKANISRKLFSKIRTDSGYRPSKNTAIAFAIALELDLDETLDLIGRAGYTLSHASRFDIIIEYSILHENYDIFEINEVLFALRENTLA